MKVYAFDVDETLEISNGPVPIKFIKALYDQGHVVGICGNWSLFVQQVPQWNKMVSFVGQFYHHMSKEDFLKYIKEAIYADEYIMVGNDPAHFGNSNDIQAAQLAGWTFIREDKFHGHLNREFSNMAQQLAAQEDALHRTRMQYESLGDLLGHELYD